MHFDPRYRLHPHDWIAIEILGKDVATCAEDDLAPGGSAQPPQEPAFDLRANEVRIDDDAAVEREHDALDVNAFAVVLRNLDDLRAAAEVVGARDAARATLGQRRSPSGALRCELDGAQRAGIVHKKIAPKIDGVAASGDCQFVESRLACELGVRIADGPPDHDGNARVNVRGFDFEVLERVRVIHHTRHRHEVDAVFEQEVPDKRQVGRGWLRGHLLVVCGQPSVGVGAGAHAVYRHRTKATALEFLLSRGLHFDRLEAGGSNDIANLWPEAAEPRPGFHEKDQVENYLHDQVCAGAMRLLEAQRAIASNWLDVYERLR